MPRSAKLSRTVLISLLRKARFLTSMERHLKDRSSKTPDNLTLLVKLVAALFVANILLTWYAVYEIRTYKQSTKALRSGMNFVEEDNSKKFGELNKFIEDQKARNQVQIDNKGTVNIRDVK